MRLQAELTPEKSEDIIEIVDGIDKFYSDYANKKVTINNAYILVLKRMNGYPEDKLQKEIEAARIGGVELNKLTIKEK
jgi:hypothetical protein